MDQGLLADKADRDYDDKQSPSINVESPRERDDVESPRNDAGDVGNGKNDEEEEEEEAEEEEEDAEDEEAMKVEVFNTLIASAKAETKDGGDLVEALRCYEEAQKLFPNDKILRRIAKIKVSKLLTQSCILALSVTFMSSLFTFLGVSEREGRIGRRRRGSF